MAVLAAALFVSAVGLATAGREMMSLGQALSWLVPGGPEALHDRSIALLGSWIWPYVIQPLLIRPAWLPFCSLALICAGAAVSLPGGGSTRRSHRRS